MVSKDASHIACSQTAVLFSKYLLKLEFQRLSIFISFPPNICLWMHSYSALGAQRLPYTPNVVNVCHEYTVVAIFWVDFVVWWFHCLIISVSLEYTYIHTNINVRPKASKAHVCFEQFKKFFLGLIHLFFSFSASNV